MKLFKKILIATDGSERNRNAVNEGIAIARELGSALYAVFVIDTSIFGTAVTGASPPSVTMVKSLRILNDEARWSLDKVRKLAGDLPVETVVLEGRPSEEIVKFAEANGIDLIVIGTLGKGGIERLLIGSVADKVIRLSSSMVLVVK